MITYLTKDAIVATLRALPPCTAAVSYALPPEACDPASRGFAESIAEDMADRYGLIASGTSGSRWRTDHNDCATVRKMLTICGVSMCKHARPQLRVGPRGEEEGR